MNISRNSWVIAVAYFFSLDFTIPRRTSLCVLFWRTVGSVILMLLISYLFGYQLGVLGATACFKPFLVVGTVIGVGIGLAITILLVRWRINRQPHEPKTLAGKYFRAVKDRVCPIINIVRETEQS